jgi:hypothetical protein
MAGLLGDISDGALLGSYTPTLRERVVAALARNWYGDTRKGYADANRLMDVVDMTPVGALGYLYDMGREAGRGNVGTAGLMASVMALPMPRTAKDDAVGLLGNAARGAAEKTKGLVGIRAYHGSPHSFDKFSMDKIGTGEGAQAYGRGLYFAENERVAKGYRDALAAKPFDIVNNAIKAASAFSGDRLDAPKMRDWLIREGFPSENITPEIVDHSIRAARGQMDDGTVTDDALMAYRALETALGGGKGSMYEVNIAADPNAFLDWDKPLSEQPEAVRRLAGWTPEAEAQYRSAQSSDTDALLAALEGDAQYSPAKMPRPSEAIVPFSASGDELHQRMFHQARKELGGEGGAGVYQARVAEKLREAGIPGIKYLDAGSRGTSGGELLGITNDGQGYRAKIKKFGGGAIGAAPTDMVTTSKPFASEQEARKWAEETIASGTRNYVVFDDKLISIVRKYGIAGASLLLGYNVLDGTTKAQAEILKKAEPRRAGSR